MTRLLIDNRCATSAREEMPSGDVQRGAKGVLSGETESCLGKQSPVWENGILFGKTEPCPGKRSLGWKDHLKIRPRDHCLPSRLLEENGNGRLATLGLPIHLEQ